mmetsp:Transcript_20203/g.43647  ORF Transcript_20203/g.43647 Transcript_20203/m.43647 type:complete len:212 (+) Transcript_20203:2138-2773(+)
MTPSRFFFQRGTAAMVDPPAAVPTATAAKPATKPIPTVTTATPTAAPVTAAYLAPSAIFCFAFFLFCFSTLKNLECSCSIWDSVSPSIAAAWLLLTKRLVVVKVVSSSCLGVGISWPSSSTSTMAGILGTSSLSAEELKVGICRSRDGSPSTPRSETCPFLDEGDRSTTLEFGVLGSSRLLLFVMCCCDALLLLPFRKIPRFFFLGSSGAT